MGTKGDRLTGTATLAAESLVDRLQPLGDIASRKMFGGYGIFDEGTMFAIVDSKGSPYLRVDESTQGEFEAAGAVRHARMPYFSIPDRILGSDEELLDWARKARSIAAGDKGK